MVQAYGDSELPVSKRADLVKVHWSREKKMWIVGGQSRGEIFILSPFFYISSKLRKTFLETGVRNVHAWVEGTLTDKQDFQHKYVEGQALIRYNLIKGIWEVLSESCDFVIFSFSEQQELEDKFHVYGCHFNSEGKVLLYFY